MDNNAINNNINNGNNIGLIMQNGNKVNINNEKIESSEIRDTDMNNININHLNNIKINSPGNQYNYINGFNNSEMTQGSDNLSDFTND